MSNKTDYRAIDIPEDKVPSEYHWTERRAEILQLIEKAGHPAKVSPTRLAERYGVTKSQISQDKDRIQEYIVDNIDPVQVDGITETVYKKSIKELVDNGEYKDAVKAVESWNNWLMDRGKVDKEPEKIEHGGNVGVTSDVVTVTSEADDTD